AAHPAAAVGVELVVVAEGRDEDAVAGGGVHDQLAVVGRDVAPVEREPNACNSLLQSLGHASASASSGQWRKALRTGTGEACPSPQIDVCSIASSHSSTFARDSSTRPSTRWCSARLPLRHGVHFWP